MATLQQIEKAMRVANSAYSTATDPVVKADMLSKAKRLAAAYKQQSAAQAMPQVSPAAQQAATAVSRSPAEQANVTAQFGAGGFLGGAGDASTGRAANIVERAMSDVGSTIKGGLETAQESGIVEAVTGDERRAEGVPNLLNGGATFGLGVGDQAKLAASLLVANDQKRQRQAVWNALPGARIVQDKNGFDIVEYEGERAYINGPGLSQQDFAKLMTDAVMLAPVGKAYQASRALPVAGRVAAGLGLGASTGAGLSVGQDIASNAMGDNPTGSDDLTADISGKRALLYAAGGAAGDAAVMGGNRLWKQFGRGGKSTPAQARSTFSQTDPVLNYDELPGPLQDEARKVTRQTTNPQDYVRRIIAANQPAPVRLTAPRAMDPANPEVHRLAQAEAYMARGGNVDYTVARKDAQDALMVNANATKTGDMNNPGLTGAEASRTISGGLNTQRRTEKGVMDDAWNRAREELASARARGAEPTAMGEDADAMLAGLRSELLNDYGYNPASTEYSSTFGVLNRLAPAVDDEGNMAAVKLTDLLTAERELRALSRGTPNSSNTAAGKAAGLLRERIDAMMFSGLLSGDEAILQQFRQAGTLRKQFGDRWEAGDIIERLTARDRKARTNLENPDPDWNLAVTPEEAANVIFGVSSSSLATRPGLRKELVALKGRLGANSQEWNAIQQAAIDRLVIPFKRNDEYGETLSGKMLRDNWLKVRDKNPEVINELFTPQQVKAMDEFTMVADWATRDIRGVGHSADNMTVISSALGNSMYRMATAGMLPRVMKWAGGLPLIGRAIDAWGDRITRRQVLSEVPMERPAAPLGARMPGIAAGAEALGYDRQGQ